MSSDKWLLFVCSQFGECATLVRSLISSNPSRQFRPKLERRPPSDFAHALLTEGDHCTKWRSAAAQVSSVFRSKMAAMPHIDAKWTLLAQSTEIWSCQHGAPRRVLRWHFQASPSLKIRNIWIPETSPQIWKMTARHRPLLGHSGHFRQIVARSLGQFWPTSDRPDHVRVFPISPYRPTFELLRSCPPPPDTSHHGLEDLHGAHTQRRALGTLLQLEYRLPLQSVQNQLSSRRLSSCQRRWLSTQIEQSSCQRRWCDVPYE